MLTRGYALQMLVFMQPMVVMAMLLENLEGDGAGSGFSSRFLLNLGRGVRFPHTLTQT